MKRKLLSGSLAIASLLFAASPVSAQTLKDFLGSSETPTLFLGVDFTKNKIIDENDVSPSDVRDRQYTGINELLVNEPKKYDLNKTFHKSNVDHDLSLVNAKNVKANTEGLLSTNSADFHRLKEGDINDVVKGYDFPGKKGIGVLIVVEAMSKGQKAIAGWVTVIDMTNKKVLLTDRVEGKTSMAFGFRNYWTAALKNLMEAVQKKKWSEWKSKAGV